jgi:hypothetical protein
LLGEAACIGPTNHVREWFHFTMRIRQVAQTAKGRPTDTPGERKDGARLTARDGRLGRNSQPGT